MDKEDDENITKYGEEICSTFKWLPIEKQKENADRLSKLTIKKDK